MQKGEENRAYAGAGNANTEPAYPHGYETKYDAGGHPDNANPGMMAQPVGRTGPSVAYSSGQTVTTQPGLLPGQVPGQPAIYVYGNQPLMYPPPDYFILSIVSCLCCCWPIAIFAILASGK